MQTADSNFIQWVYSVSSLINHDNICLADNGIHGKPTSSDHLMDFPFSKQAWMIG